MYITEEQADRIKFSLLPREINSKGEPKPDTIEVRFDPSFQTSNRLVRSLGFTPDELVDGIKEVCGLLPDYHSRKRTLYISFNQRFREKYPACKDFVEMQAREYKTEHDACVLFKTTEN